MKYSRKVFLWLCLMFSNSAIALASPCLHCEHDGPEACRKCMENYKDGKVKELPPVESVPKPTPSLPAMNSREKVEIKIVGTPYPNGTYPEVFKLEKK